MFKRSDAPAAQQELMEALRRAKRDLSHAYLAFNDAVDPDLVDACIFEIRAHQARINYLLRAMKSEEEQALAAVGKEGKRRWI